jgi:hypothetical protein
MLIKAGKNIATGSVQANTAASTHRRLHRPSDGGPAGRIEHWQAMLRMLCADL